MALEFKRSHKQLFWKKIETQKKNRQSHKREH